MSIELTLDKVKVRRSFSAAADSYDGLAGLQRQVGLELLRRFPLRCGDDVLVDVGCGTGFLSHQLASAFLGKQLIALDLAMPMLQTCRRNYPGMSAQYVCADAEKLPFASNSIDQIYSNLALQWAQDLSATLLDFKRVLKGKGRLVFATFGPQTLHELKTAWAAVDDFTHVNSFYAVEQIEGFLHAAGFENSCLESRLYQSDYLSVEGLMRELKGIGAHNVNRDRNPKPTTKTQLQAMIGHYQKQMAGQGIVASYEIIFVQANC